MDACQPPASHTASRPSWLPPALQVRPFRWYWAAQWPVLIGTWMQIVALGFFVFQLTHSQTAVGIVAAADGVPAVALSLAGGALADRVPRRRIPLVTHSVLGPSSGTLAVLALTGRARGGGRRPAGPRRPGVRRGALLPRRLLHALPAGLRGHVPARGRRRPRPALQHRRRRRADRRAAHRRPGPAQHPGADARWGRPLLCRRAGDAHPVPHPGDGPARAGGDQLRLPRHEHLDDHPAPDRHRPRAARPVARPLHHHLRRPAAAGDAPLRGGRPPGPALRRDHRRRPAGRGGCGVDGDAAGDPQHRPGLIGTRRPGRYHAEPMASSARRRRLPVLVPVVLALVAGGVVATTQVLGRRSSTPPRGPVAEIGGARIPASLFDLRLGSALTAIRQAGGAPEPGDPAYPAFLAGVKRRVMESLIIHQVIAQEAGYRHLAASDADVAAEIAADARSAGGEDRLEEQLSAAGGNLDQL